MNKRICDHCKKETKGEYSIVHFSKIKDLIFETFDVCEKCVNYIPKIIKDIHIKRAKRV